MTRCDVLVVDSTYVSSCYVDLRYVAGTYESLTTLAMLQCFIIHEGFGLMQRVMHGIDRHDELSPNPGSFWWLAGVGLRFDQMVTSDPLLSHVASKLASLEIASS